MTMGADATVFKAAVDTLREKGEKVGLLKLVLFNPFPRDDFLKAIRRCKELIIHDRNFVGLEGAIDTERTRGVGFYPVPARFARPLNALWPGGSHTVLVVGRRAGTHNPWQSILEGEQTEALQTFFSAAPGDRDRAS